MTTAHWIYLMAIAAWTALLLCFSLASQGNSPLYRWGQKIFWAIAMLHLGQSLGAPGLNGLNLMIASCLGAPGYLTLCAISLL